MNNTDGYRKDDIDAMNTLLKEAQDIINKADATKDEILDISHRLADQLTKMVKIDKSTLESVIETAKALDPEEYTEESYKALADAIAAGEVVLKDENATNKDVETAIANISEAIKNLVEDETTTLNKAES